MASMRFLPASRMSNPARRNLCSRMSAAAHDRDPLLPGPLRLRWKGGFGGSYRIVDVGFPRRRETADDYLVVGRRADLEGVVTGALFATDNQWVGLTKVTAKFLEGRIEGIVHRRD